MLQIQFVKNNNPDYISNGFHQKFFTRTVRWWLMVLIFVPEHCHLKRHCARQSTWSWIIYYHLIWAPASIQLSMGNYFNCPVKYPKDFSRCREKTTISNKCIFKPSMSHLYWQHAHRDHFNVIAGERWWVWGQWMVMVDGGYGDSGSPACLVARSLLDSVALPWSWSPSWTRINHFVPPCVSDDRQYFNWYNSMIGPNVTPWSPLCLVTIKSTDLVATRPGQAHHISRNQTQSTITFHHVFCLRVETPFIVLQV